MAGVRVSALSKSYGALSVLRDIDLEVAEGEFTVLLGPSGCGKSTLLNAIAGLDDINDGTIMIGGEDVTAREPSKRGIAMVFQSYALYPTMTVRGNLSFGLKVKGRPRAEIEKRVAWAAELLQITPQLDRKPGQMSGGQRQRVAIGRALVQDARLFLFDEPLSNLDAKLRTEMRVEIKKLHKELGLTIVYVTHDQIEAMTLATRIAVMQGGRIEQYAAPDELYERPETLFVAGFVGAPAMNFLPGIWRAGAVEVDGIRIPAGALDLRAPVADGTSVVLGVRPEHIGLAEDGAPGEAIATTMQFMEPMGADTLGWFAMGGHRLSVRLAPQRARAVAGATTLALDLRLASLFDATTERRL
ncbi:MAG: sn-glycerol-3-phosphate ABC transporter ATP-binding protein UgpC [Alphaproteobacteria bacterium]|nr:sn-glycerol-3-phosphate ABC transporter ATP-binding protein UgpC [Alphaproteobacteria bacterium]